MPPKEAPPGPVEKAITRSKDPMMRRQRHHELVVDAAQAIGSWEHEGVRFIVTQAARIDGTTGCVAVNLLAADDHGLLPGLDNPYLFDRPPIKVRDGESIVEDAVRAFQQAVAGTVFAQARAAGWRQT